MSHRGKNRALLIVNCEFHSRWSSEELQSRPGAKREAKRLFNALSKCNYAVKVHYDLTAKEIEDIYEEECYAEQGDCFISIISSHGTEGSIFDCEGQPVQLTRIFNILSPQRSHNLVGKPKIFFIQVKGGAQAYNFSTCF
uniref:Caspase family p20 domain-containing protein n=1 Tax=Varanus komodoensis TaxID=61221 RepID=A0A8D2LKF2_VARKO